MNYPYYIVTWQEGRLPCPPQYKGTVIQRQFDKGHIGGRRNIEKKVQTPKEALQLLRQDRFNRTVYQVASRNSCRKRIRLPMLEMFVKGESQL